MCVLSIKVAVRKKSGNWFNDPRSYISNDHFFMCVFSPFLSFLILSFYHIALYFWLIYFLSFFLTSFLHIYRILFSLTHIISLYSAYLYAVYWPSTPPNMPFQRRRLCIFHWRGRVWLTIWDRVKILRYSHRLMHRKRVTCELHDSYFHLMTIKHAIPGTVEVTHSDGQLWGDIEWAIELLFNSVKTGSQLVWRPDPLVTRCRWESQYPAGWPPGLQLSNPGKRGRSTDGHKSGGKYAAVLFRLQLPLTVKPWVTLFEPFQ